MINYLCFFGRLNKKNMSVCVLAWWKDRKNIQMEIVCSWVHYLDLLPLFISISLSLSLIEFLRNLFENSTI